MASSPRNLKHCIMEVENVILEYQQPPEACWISILLGLSIYH